MWTMMTSYAVRQRYKIKSNLQAWLWEEVGMNVKDDPLLVKWAVLWGIVWMRRFSITYKCSKCIPGGKKILRGITLWVEQNFRGDSTPRFHLPTNIIRDPLPVKILILKEHQSSQDRRRIKKKEACRSSLEYPWSGSDWVQCALPLLRVVF